LSLLIPTQNHQAGPIGKGKFTLNPGKTGSNDLSHYEFLGILMGVCIRTGAHLTLDLPAFVWKQLTGQKLVAEDLNELDFGFCSLLQYMVSVD